MTEPHAKELLPRLISWGIAYTPAAVLAVLLPKCPLCIAAQLALIGVAIPLPGYARALIIVVSIVLGTAVIVARKKSATSGGVACGGICAPTRSRHEHHNMKEIGR